MNFSFDASASSSSSVNETFRKKERSDVQDGVYWQSSSSEVSSVSSDNSISLSLGTAENKVRLSSSHNSSSDTSSAFVETSQMYGDSDVTGVGTPYGATWFEFRGKVSGEKSDYEESSSRFELTLGGEDDFSVDNTSSGSADGSETYIDESTNHSVLLDGSEVVDVVTDTMSLVYTLTISDDGDATGSVTTTHTVEYSDPAVTDISETETVDIDFSDDVVRSQEQILADYRAHAEQRARLQHLRDNETDPAMQTVYDDQIATQDDILADLTAEADEAGIPAATLQTIVDEAAAGVTANPPSVDDGGDGDGGDSGWGPSVLALIWAKPPGGGAPAPTSGNGFTIGVGGGVDLNFFVGNEQAEHAWKCLGYRPYRVTARKELGD